MSSVKTIKEIFSDNRIQHFVTSEKFKFNIGLQHIGLLYNATDTLYKFL